MKLYTRRGDDGATDLFGGGRAAKDSPRIDAIGAVDELNAHVGLAAAACADGRLRSELLALQARLFELGADLAAPRAQGEPPPAAVPAVGPEQIAEAERLIDRADADAPPLRHFVLPGGTELAARLHVARAVCRRAERACVALSHHEPVSRDALIYLNRLSDLLFALARQANALAGVADMPWLGRDR